MTKTRTLSVDDAEEAFRYYVRAFGAKTVSRSSSEGRMVICSALAVDGSTLVLCEPGAADHRASASPGMELHFVVAADVAPVWDSALAAGAEAWTALETAAEEVSGILRDPFGHVWQIASPHCATDAELDAAAAHIRACWETEHPSPPTPSAPESRRGTI